MAQNNAANLQHTQFNVIVGGPNNDVVNIAPSATSGVPLVSNGAASNPSFTTAVVAGGGCGTVSYTAYSVICAGTTATGAFQNVSGVGTAGQVLTSNGAGTLPTWQTGGGGSSFTVTKFTASGTWTKAASTKVVEFIIWAGGSGGGSGRRGASTSAGGGGGGAGGGVVHMIVPQDFFASSETVTVGGTAAGGIAQSSNTTNGNAGTVGNDSSIGNVTAIGGGAPGGGTTSSGTAGAGKSKYAFHTIDTLQAPGGSGSAAAPVSGAATNTDGLNPTGGGGGSGADSTTARQAGSGGAIKDYTTTVTLIAAAAGGIETGTIAGADGTNFVQGTSSRGWLAGGSGGGGGGGQKSGGSAGKGGDGGTPGGGGGGGGGSLNGTNSGAGGIGARGEIWVIEYA